MGHFSHRILVIFICQVVPSMTNLLIDNWSDSDSHYDFPTEPPELVESFDPQSWISQAVVSQQVEIKRLKLETQIKLRYARTRIILQLANPNNKELQTDFKIVLPDNAFFTAFQLKKGSSPRTYSAQIVKRELARKIYHSARSGANGTVSAGYVELSQKTDSEFRDTTHFYNLKVSLPPDECIQVFLVYERQLNRVSNAYSDRIHVFPSNPLLQTAAVGQVEFSVNVEEIENIQRFRCMDKAEAGADNFSNCTLKAKRKRNQSGRKITYMELNWRGKQVASTRLQQYSFNFQYELEHRNDTTTAVVISQANGNFYFVHLLVPQNLPLLPKHIIFLLDISDSMHGKKLDQLQWSMNEILNDLEPHDFFNIIAFANDITVFQAVLEDTESEEVWGNERKCPFPYPATEEYKKSAVTFIQEKMIAHGTTDIYLGLSEAFRLIRSVSPGTFPADTCKDGSAARKGSKRKLPENAESMIFFLSDGQATAGPTNMTYLLKTFYDLNHDQDNGSAKVVPLHTIAYGEDADVPFLRELSALNLGVSKVISEESAAGIELTNFYNEISSQVLSQVKTFVSQNGSAPAQLSFPVTVIQGGEVITTGKLVGQNSNSSSNWTTEAIGKSGKLAYFNSPVYDCTNLQMTIDRCVDRINFYLERLQAYQLLKKLLERDKLVQNGYICPQSYHDQFQDLKMARLSNYAEYEEENPYCYNIYKQQVTELALKHGFVTSYTSFILTTAEVDSGLSPEDQPPDSEEGSIEQRFLPLSSRVVTSEKLILMRSVSSVDPEKNPPRSHRIGAQRVMEPALLPNEIMPSASKLVENSKAVQESSADETLQISKSLMEVKSFNRSITITTNSTTTTNQTSNVLTKSMRDVAMAVLRKLFPSIVRKNHKE